MYKVKNENCQTNAAKRLSVEAEDAFGFQPLVKIVNEMPLENQVPLVDTMYYIDRTYRIISKIEKVKFRTRRTENSQMSLF